MNKPKKMKIKVKKAHRDFRLLSFNVYDQKEEQDAEHDEDAPRVDSKEFIVQMFGINDKGETCAIYASGFTPFFYVKVDKSWYNNQGKLLGFRAQISKEIGNYFENSIISMNYISKRNYMDLMQEKNTHLSKSNLKMKVQ